ncbi:FecR family protein [Alkaliflexus imshenetskii]|uniref:FecR family protein n=1 Tax=Alkaliflexus imshenetskii TaxID=286730 RepID=UPI00047C2A6D|nr:FecR domain-containing protein [Alkaliflexus imshenetskii]
MDVNEKDWERLVTYFSGNASDEEMRDVEAWTSESRQNRRYFDEVREVWCATELANKSDRFQPGPAWRTFSRWFDLQKKHENAIRFRQTLWGITRYAAMVLLTLAVSWFLFHQNSKEDFTGFVVEVPYGQRSNVVLPDGTRVALNSGTTFRVIHLSDTERRVHLSGEGFFNVAHDSRNPFVVETQNFDIRVLGTSFNIKTYKDDNLASAYLVEGSVQIEMPGMNAVKILPGDKVEFLGQGQLKTIKGLDERAILSWQEGRYIFRQEKLADIARTLERAYDIRVEFETEQVKEERYTGSLDVNEHVTDVMNRLVITSGFPLRYRLSNRVLTISADYR